MAEDRVEFERKDGIGIAWIDNQAKRNALSSRVLADLSAILDTVERDGKIKVLVIAPRGKHFSAGFDIGGIDDLPALRERLALFARTLPQIERLSVPVIAAARGYVYGGGFELALACDMIVASERAVFWFPEANLGGCPPFACLRLYQIVGRPRAKEIIMTCKQLSASEALALGIVNRVVKEEELIDSALSLAQDIAQKGSAVIQMIKIGINRELGSSDIAYWRGCDLAPKSYEDWQKGIKAFFGAKQ
jgi:enoyl-CoA hydratase